MPIPRHSVALPSVQLPVEAGCGGVTELRVHGVGGSPPDAILGDLAPEQASGDAIAGFYRTSDHRASAGDLDADRHVEAQARMVTAAALRAGLADDEFWDGESSVRLLTGVHLAVVIGFLAIVLGVTAKALTGTGSAHAIALGWIAIALGDRLRGRVAYLLVPAAAALIAAGVFAFVQPGGKTGRAAVVVRNVGVTIASLALPALMAFLYSAWNDPAKRRTIGVLWDVGTFWPTPASGR